MRDSAGLRRWSIYVARSRDGGRTFAAAAPLVPDNTLLKAESPVVLRDGTLVVAWSDVARNNGQQGGGDYLARRPAWVVRSVDGGRTFGVPLFVTEDCGPPLFSLSALAADTAAARDRLYFACERAGGHDLAFTSSGDRGETWLDTTIALSASPDTSVRRYKPALAVNGRGVLLAAWVEVEGTPPGRPPWSHCLALHAAASTDGGRGFGAPALVSRSCPTQAANGANSPAGGDYFGLVALPDGRFRLVWPDARDGAFQLWTTTIDVAPAP